LAQAEVNLTAAKASIPANINGAKENLNAAKETVAMMQNATHPGERQSATAAILEAQAALNSARNDLSRQQELLAHGLTSPSEVETARSRWATAQAAVNNA